MREIDKLPESGSLGGLVGVKREATSLYLIDRSADACCLDYILNFNTIFFFPLESLMTPNRSRLGQHRTTRPIGILTHSGSLPIFAHLDSANAL